MVQSFTTTELATKSLGSFPPVGVQRKSSFFDYTTSAERMRIDQTGNVGIGTTGSTYQLYLSTDSAGRGRIRTGDFEIIIKTKTVRSTSKVFLTFLGDLVDRTYHVSKITEGHSFTVRLSRATPYDVDFDWWLIDTEDKGANLQYSSPEPLPTAAIAPSSTPSVAPKSDEKPTTLENETAAAGESAPAQVILPLAAE